MKIYFTWLAFGSVTAQHVLTYTELLEAVALLGQRMVGYMKFNPTNACPRGFKPPCFNIRSERESVLGIDGFEEIPPYDVALYFAAADKADLKQLERYHTTHAVLITEGNPSCTPVILGLKEMANALLGPADLEISDAKIKEFTEKFKKGIDLDIPNLFGKKSVISYHYSNEEMKKTINATMQGTTFKAPAGQVCVPVSLMLGLKCSFPKRMINLFDHGKQIASKTSDQSAEDLLPLDPSSGRNLFPVSGCISEYIP